MPRYALFFKTHATQTFSTMPIHEDTIQHGIQRDKNLTWFASSDVIDVRAAVKEVFTAEAEGALRAGAPRQNSLIMDREGALDIRGILRETNPRVFCTKMAVFIDPQSERGMSAFPIPGDVIQSGLQYDDGLNWFATPKPVLSAHEAREAVYAVDGAFDSLHTKVMPRDEAVAQINQVLRETNPGVYRRRPELAENAL